jgi:hypothetical protein
MQQLVDMIRIMLADGQIDQREIDLCITLATRMGFRPSQVTALVQHIMVLPENPCSPQDIEGVNTGTDQAKRA